MIRYYVYTGLKCPVDDYTKRRGKYVGLGRYVPLKKGQKTIPDRRIFDNLDDARKCSNFFKRPIYEVKQITTHKVRKVK